MAVEGAALDFALHCGGVPHGHEHGHRHLGMDMGMDLYSHQDMDMDTSRKQCIRFCTCIHAMIERAANGNVDTNGCRELGFRV